MHSETQPAESGSPAPVDHYPPRLRESLAGLIRSIYPEQDANTLTHEVLEAFWGTTTRPRRRGRTLTNTLWNEKDSYLICYGNSLLDGQHKPLVGANQIHKRFPVNRHM